MAFIWVLGHYFTYFGGLGRSFVLDFSERRLVFFFGLAVSGLGFGVQGGALYTNPFITRAKLMCSHPALRTPLSTKIAIAVMICVAWQNAGARKAVCSSSMPNVATITITTSGVFTYKA